MEASNNTEQATTELAVDLSTAPNRRRSLDADENVGKTIHVYQCDSLLGAGGMGKVYLAYHTHLERPCALKILHPRETELFEEYRHRFLEEGRAAAALNHPHIVTTHAIGEVQERHFLEMEFVAGGTLSNLVRERKQLLVLRALGIACKLASGLAAAHRQQILHQDLKLENVLLTPDGQPKICDFGLAKRVFIGDRHLENTLVGTPSHMAPELFQGARTSPASDVYALGVCLFQMLTGKIPFEGETIRDQVQAAATQPIPSLRRIRNDVPLVVVDGIERMLAKNPDNRLQDGFEAFQLLTAILGELRDIESLLNEAFEHETHISWSRWQDGFRLTAKLDGGRHQDVFVVPSDHKTEQRLLVIYSLCAPVQKSFFENALRLNAELSHAGIAIREIDGESYFVMQNTYPRGTADPQEVRESVLEIAEQADIIEKVLTGKDIH